MQFKTFCAANSGKGFISFFDTILDEKNKQIYYIKGGPGSGKSTLMRKIASMTTNAELIFCSGDPKSLDGLILPNENAVIIDATAPHSHEPKFPGVGGNIIDLGEGWEREKLNKERIIALSEEKSALYQDCYQILKSAKSLQEGVFFPIKEKLNMQKITAIGDKLLKQNALWDQRDKTAHRSKRFLAGISPDGRITHFDTFETLGKNMVVLEDRFMQSHLLLNHLEVRLTQKGIDHIIGYHPLFGEPILQHLIIPEASLSIISKDGFFPFEIPEESVIKRINLQSFIDKTFLQENKNKLIFMKRLERELLEVASEKLNIARALHMELEQEYAKGYNFDLTDALKTKLINNLFG